MNLKLLSAKDVPQPIKISIWKNGKIAVAPSAAKALGVQSGQAILLYQDEDSPDNKLNYYMRIIGSTDSAFLDGYKIAGKDDDWLFAETKGRFDMDKLDYLKKTVTFEATPETVAGLKYFKLAGVQRDNRGRKGKDGEEGEEEEDIFG